VKDGQPIENTDIAAWYTMGFHHIPRPEDWPVLPTKWHEMKLWPLGFFERSPVIDTPAKFATQ
jgi:primary-amine oxidase